MIDPKISDLEKVKLLILYNLRYENESGNQAARIVTELLKAGYPPPLVSHVSSVATYGGVEKRNGDLFGNKNSGALQKIRKSMFVNQPVSESPFLQHKPLLEKILQQVLKGQLSETEFPVQGIEASKKQNHSNSNPNHSKHGSTNSLPSLSQNSSDSKKASIQFGESRKQSPSQILVFIYGGITHEEEKVVFQFNSANRTHNVFFAGNFFLNSNSFLSFF